MPLTDELDNRGSEADGAPSTRFCGMCYRDGAFTMPDLTVEAMVQMSTDYMSDRMGFDRAQAEQLSQDFIPTLQRWVE